MANTIEKLISSKKNRPVLIAIIGFVLLYLYSRRSATGGGSSGVPIGGGYIGGTDRNIPGEIEPGQPQPHEPQPVSNTPKVPFAGVLANNPAVNSFEQDGYLYEFINTQNASVEVQQDGKVKLIVPANKIARSGSNVCIPHIIAGAYGNYLSDTDKAALLGDGLDVPEGCTTFLVLYSTASTVEAHKSNKNKYILEESQTGQASTHSAAAEAVIFSKTPSEQTAENGEFVIPAQIQRAGWIPAYHFLNHDLGNPQNNRFGITRYWANANVAEQFGKHFTALQWVYEWLNPYPDGKLWDNKQDTGKNNAEYLAANERIGKDYILFAEIWENNGETDPPDLGLIKAETTYQLLFNRMKNADSSVTSPEHTRLYSDYQAARDGGGLFVPFSENNETILTACLASQANARKLTHNGEFVSDGYYHRGYHEYRNLTHPAYLPNLLHHSPLGIYDLIFNLEKYNISVPSRRLGLMTTPIMEALGQDQVTNRGIKFELNLPGGRKVSRASTIPHSFESLYTQCFYAYLLGNETDIVIWDSSIPMNLNPFTFKQSWYGGFDAWKTEYKPEGGAWVRFEPGNPNHPQQLTTDDRSEFPELPQHAEGGVFAARLQIKRITEDEDLVSDGIFYAPYTYTVNDGAEQNGYRDGEDPQGPNNGRLSARGFSNAGQHNIVHLGKDKKPIFLQGEGAGGKVLIMQNPWASLTDVTEFITEHGNYTLTGNSLKIFKVSEV